MSKLLLDLEDCQITDKGEVVFKYPAVFEMLRRKTDISGIRVQPHDDVKLYNQRHPEGALEVFVPSGDEEAPPVETYRFNIPEEFLEIDLDVYMTAKLIHMFGDDVPLEYAERVDLELQMMRDRSMEDFIRTLIYMVDVFDRNDVVHGVGRGSSCASLVLHLIGIHMVDPIKYQIPIGEFLR